MAKGDFMMKFPLDQAAVVFVDVINNFNFDGGEDLYANTLKIVPHMQKLKHFARENELPVIYVNDHYGLWKSDSKLLIEHCWNERSQNVIGPLRPEEADYFLMKPMHSAFFQSPLQSLLEDLGKNKLILAGIAGDICLLFTAQDAYMQQYDMWIPENCMASETDLGNSHALALMHSVMNAKTDSI